jgi:hypothetical protein
VNKQELINHLEVIANAELPHRFYQYKKDELRELVHYADNIVDFQNAGLDKLFESMSLTMKYIPNFVLISLTQRYLEPALAARITQKLTMKQITTVGNGLPADYLAEVSRYQEVQLSARIFEKLDQQHSLAILKVLCIKRPLKVLDLYASLITRHQQFVADELDLTTINEKELRAEGRKTAYSELSQLQR